MKHKSVTPLKWCYRSCRPEFSVKQVFIKIFLKITGKYLYQSLFSIELQAAAPFFQRAPLMVASRAIVLIGLQNLTKKKSTCFYTKFITTRKLRFIERLYLQIFTLQFCSELKHSSFDTYLRYIYCNIFHYIFFQLLSNWDSHNFIIMTFCI